MLFASRFSWQNRVWRPGFVVIVEIMHRCLWLWI